MWPTGSCRTRPEPASPGKGSDAGPRGWRWCPIALIFYPTAIPPDAALLALHQGGFCLCGAPHRGGCPEASGGAPCLTAPLPWISNGLRVQRPARSPGGGPGPRGPDHAVSPLGSALTFCAGGSPPRRCPPGPTPRLSAVPRTARAGPHRRSWGCGRSGRPQAGR